MMHALVSLILFTSAHAIPHAHLAASLAAQVAADASPTPAAGGDGCTVVGGIDPCQVHSTIDWSAIQHSLVDLVAHFGGILTALILGVSAALGVFIGLRYMVGNGNQRRIEAARASFIRLIEGFALTLSVGLIMGIVTLVVKAAGA